MTRDLSRRSDETELMDAQDVDYETFRGCLRDLARVNALSRGYRPTLAFLEALRAGGRLPARRAVEILDVGSGYGDTLREVARWAGRHGLRVRLTGLDLNPWSARAAREATDLAMPIRWATGDVFAHQGGADVVLSALFTHHLDDAGVVRFLRWSEASAPSGWFVNDLRRAWLPATGFGPLAALMGMHRFVRHDGPASFRRAFVPAEWRRFLAEAGIPEGAARLTGGAPFRLCVARPGGAA